MNKQINRSNAIEILKKITAIISIERLRPPEENAKTVGISRTTAYRLIDGTRSISGVARGPRRFDSLVMTAREYGLSVEASTHNGQVFDLTDEDTISDMYDAVRGVCDKMTGIEFTRRTAFSNATHHSFVYGDKISALTTLTVYSALVEPLYF